MRKFQASVLFVAATILGGFLAPRFANAQAPGNKGLVTQLKQQLTTDVIIQKPGILGVPATQQLTGVTTVSVEDGKVHTPGFGQRLVLGAYTKLLPVGDKLAVADITADYKKDSLTLTVVECAKCNEIDPGAVYKAFITFQFPKGYLSTADTGQVFDAISQLLAVDSAAAATESQPQAPPDAPTPPAALQAGVLTNDDVLKMVQAKLPDSVIVAKIQSSACQLDTSADALIALQKAGASEAVLKAVTQATADAPAEPPGPSKGPQSNSVCAEYSVCISTGKQALVAAQWDSALAAFQAASALDASKPAAWEGLGNVALATGKMDDAAAMWDKALAAGGPLTFAACHETVGCRSGAFTLTPSQFSFAFEDGRSLFTVATSEVTPAGVQDRNIYHAVELHLKIASKNYNFYFIPFGIVCTIQGAVNCPQEGMEQQRAAFEYISRTIPTLATTTAPSKPSSAVPAPSPAKN